VARDEASHLEFLLESTAYRQFGFASFGDLVRERLGRSPRTVRRSGLRTWLSWTNDTLMPALRKPLLFQTSEKNPLASPMRLGRTTFTSGRAVSNISICAIYRSKAPTARGSASVQFAGRACPRKINRNGPAHCRTITFAVGLRRDSHRDTLAPRGANRRQRLPRKRRTILSPPRPSRQRTPVTRSRLATRTLQ